MSQKVPQEVRSAAYQMAKEKYNPNETKQYGKGLSEYDRLLQDYQSRGENSEIAGYLKRQSK